MEGLAVEDGDVVRLAPAAVARPVGRGRRVSGGGGGGGRRPRPAAVVAAAAASVALLAEDVGDRVEVHLAHVVLPEEGGIDIVLLTLRIMWAYGR